MGAILEPFFTCAPTLVAWAGLEYGSLAVVEGSRRGMPQSQKHLSGPKARDPGSSVCVCKCVCTYTCMPIRTHTIQYLSK